jgi:secreted trypsin-like serine protease
MKKLISIVAAALAAVAVAVPAFAITGGRADGTAHPFTGLIVAASGTPLCSAVLVAPSVVVTAAHCFAGEEDVFVSFDAVVDRTSSSFVAGHAIPDPQFGGKTDTHDIAVVVLDHPISGIAPARLPGAGAVDRLAKAQEIVNVGYGFDSAKTPVFDGVRRTSTSVLAKVDATTISLKLREGGVCFGDSGGPQLAGDVVAAIVSTGNKTCSGQSTGYRLDTPSARAFLAPYVDAKTAVAAAL